jgi:DNA-binding MarR family transcriptional regulator
MKKTINPTEEFNRQRLDIPGELFSEGMQLSPFRVYFRLRYMSNGADFVHVTHENLAKRLRLDAETIRRSVRHLERTGCIKTSASEHPFSKKPMNRYDFLPGTPINEWVKNARA